MAPNGEIIMDFSLYDAKKAGFSLKNTLSENGTLTRGGVADETGHLVKVIENEVYPQNLWK